MHFPRSGLLGRAHFALGEIVELDPVFDPAAETHGPILDVEPKPHHADTVAVGPAHRLVGDLDARDGAAHSIVGARHRHVPVLGREVHIARLGVSVLRGAGPRTLHQVRKHQEELEEPHSGAGPGRTVRKPRCPRDKVREGELHDQPVRWMLQPFFLCEGLQHNAREGVIFGFE